MALEAAATAATEGLEILAEWLLSLEREEWGSNNSQFGAEGVSLFEGEAKNKRDTASFDIVLFKATNYYSVCNI